jgi:hypothetical protein
VAAQLHLLGEQLIARRAVGGALAGKPNRMLRLAHR